MVDHDGTDQVSGPKLVYGWVQPFLPDTCFVLCQGLMSRHPLDIVLYVCDTAHVPGVFSSCSTTKSMTLAFDITSSVRPCFPAKFYIFFQLYEIFSTHTICNK
jgi:hypothetical protein